MPKDHQAPPPQSNPNPTHTPMPQQGPENYVTRTPTPLPSEGQQVQKVVPDTRSSESVSKGGNSGESQ